MKLRPAKVKVRATRGNCMDAYSPTESSCFTVRRSWVAFMPGPEGGLYMAVTTSACKLVKLPIPTVTLCELLSRREL